MHKTFTRFSRLMVFGMFAGFTLSAYAVNAKPGLITAMQPDGSTICIRIEGNEYANRAFTTDGWLLTVDEKGYYVFATLDSDGNPSASRFKADTPQTRHADTRVFLSSADKETIIDAFNRQQKALPSPPAYGKARTKGGPGRFNDSYPVFGEQKAVVLLVEFADNEFTTSDDPKAYFERMLNEEGFSENFASGSARDYFIANSMGKFQPQFDVFGPVKLENNMEYYGAHAAGANDRRPEKMIVEACQLLDDQVDFSVYDCDGDGVIDNVYVFYAGMGEASGGGNNTIWPHSAFLTDISKKKYYLDELLLDRYACSNELEVSNETVGIGTFVHEFSHVLGLPDLYSTGYTGAFTPGSWSCIDNGNYNNNGHTPPYYSAFERYALGWLEPTVLDAPGEYSLDKIHMANEAFIIPTGREEEYFLFENRQQEGLDIYIPGHGMLVWHVDFNVEQWLKNTLNNDPDHQHVDIIEADNVLSDRTRSGDTFPGEAAITAFSPSTVPAFLSWDNTDLGFGLYDIAEDENGLISFRLIIEDNSTDQIIAMNDGLISISGNTVTAANESVFVYDCSGRRINTDGKSTITLHPGIYIASDGVRSRKFAIH